MRYEAITDYVLDMFKLHLQHNFKKLFKWMRYSINPEKERNEQLDQLLFSDDNRKTYPAQFNIKIIEL